MSLGTHRFAFIIIHVCCIYTCTCVCLRACTCVCVRVPHRDKSAIMSIILFRQGLLGNREFIDWLDLLASRVQGSSRPCLPSTGITGTKCYLCLVFTVVPGWNPGLYDHEVSTLPTEPAPHSPSFGAGYGES